MRKTLFFAFALAASVLAFNACNDKDQNNPSNSQDTEKPANDSTAGDPQHPIKGVTFYYDHERGGHVRKSLYFGLDNNFVSGRDTYEDEARTKKISEGGDYGTYVLNEDSSYIDMTFLGAFVVIDGQREDHPGQQAQKDGRWTYKLDGDTLTITAENGYSEKYWKK